MKILQNLTLFVISILNKVVRTALYFYKGVPASKKVVNLWCSV